MKRKTNDKGQTASDFIRSCGKDVPAKDVVAAGAEAGLKFKAGLVYMIRSKANGKGKPKKAKRMKRANGTKRVGRRSRATASSAKIPVSVSAIVEQFKSDLEAAFVEKMTDRFMQLWSPES